MAKASTGVSRNGPALTFAQALAAWDDRRLTRLLSLRQDLGRPAPRTLAALVERAANWSSVQHCRGMLDRGAQQALDAVCLIPEPRTVPSLVRLLGGTSRAVGLDEALARLEDCALVLRLGDTLLAAPGTAGLHNPARLGPPAAQALASHHAAALSTMARRLGVRAGNSRASALAAVTGAISDPERVELVLSSGPPECAKIAYMAANEGPAIAARGGVYALSDRTPAGWLTSHGVLAPLSWDTLVMPREVALALRGGTPFPDLELSPPEALTEEVDAGALDALAAERALRLVGDVRTVLDLWGQSGPAVLKDGGIGVREVRRAAKALDRPEGEAALVIEIAAGAGLVTPGRPAGAVLPLPAYDQWLAMEVPQRWERLVQGWLDSELHPSLAGALDQREKVISPLLDRSPERRAAHRRAQVIGIIATPPVGAAVTGASLAALAEWSAPDLWAGGPAPPPRLRHWVMAEAEAVGLVALGALSSFGRLAVRAWMDPSASASGSAAPPGSAAAALAHWAPAVSSNFVVQADLTAVAPGELTSAVRSELELLADVESKGAATVYRFSEASLRRGFDAGRTATQIVAFLEEHASRGVPQALAYLVGDLGRRFGSLRVGAASCYLRCEDPALISEILAARRTSKLGLRQLAPTVLVSAAHTATTLSMLRNSGYLPALEDDDAELVIIDVAPQRATAPVARPWASGDFDPAALISALRKGGAQTGAPVSAQTEPRRLWPPDLPALPPGLSESNAAVLAELFSEMWQEMGEGGFGIESILDESDLDESYLDGSDPGRDPELDDGPGAAQECTPRPTAIVRSGAEVMALLDRAYDEDWMVRVGYKGGKGRPIQLNCLLLTVDHDEVEVQCEPRWDERVLVVTRIEWVRVLTEAEEEMLL